MFGKDYTIFENVIGKTKKNKDYKLYFFLYIFFIDTFLVYFNVFVCKLISMMPHSEKDKTNQKMITFVN